MPTCLDAGRAKEPFDGVKEGVFGLGQALDRLLARRRSGNKRQPRLIYEAREGAEPAVYGRVGLSAQVLRVGVLSQAKAVAPTDSPGFSAAARRLEAIPAKRRTTERRWRAQLAFPGWRNSGIAALMSLRMMSRDAAEMALAYNLMDHAEGLNTEFQGKSFRAPNGVLLPVTTLERIVGGEWLDDEAINALLPLLNGKPHESPFEVPYYRAFDPWDVEDVEAYPDAIPPDQTNHSDASAEEFPATLLPSRLAAPLAEAPRPVALWLENAPTLLPRNQVLYMNSHFFEALRSRSASAVLPWLDKTRRDFKKIRVFGCPINLRNVHWVAIAVDFCTRTIVYSDSLGGLDLELCITFLDFLRHAAGRFGVSVEELEEYSIIGCGYGLPASSLMSALPPLPEHCQEEVQQHPATEESEDVIELTSSDEGGSESRGSNPVAGGEESDKEGGNSSDADSRGSKPSSYGSSFEEPIDPDEPPTDLPPAHEILEWILSPANGKFFRRIYLRWRRRVGVDSSEDGKPQKGFVTSEPQALVLRTRLYSRIQNLCADIGPHLTEAAMSLFDQVLHAALSPRQENGSDCGLFSLSFLRFMAGGPPCALEGLSSEARRSLARELLEGALAPQ